MTSWQGQHTLHGKGKEPRIRLSFFFGTTVTYSGHESVIVPEACDHKNQCTLALREVHLKI